MALVGLPTPTDLSFLEQMVIIGVVLGLITGLIVAPVAFTATQEPEVNQVAVVPIQGVIEGTNVQSTAQRLTKARLDSSIEAVVLVINSPGGLATAGEELFFQVDRTAQEIPVVAVIHGIGASAGYKAALPADTIYVKPATFIGSVGTIGITPPTADPVDFQTTTGPFKSGGNTKRGFQYGTAMVGQSFSETVWDYRGDNLTISQSEVEKAKLYSGIEGVKIGLADDIGDVQAGIQRAATLADIDQYDVTTLEYQTEIKFLEQSTYAESSHDNKTIIRIEDLVTNRKNKITPTVLMLPRSVLHQLETGPANTTNGNETTTKEAPVHGE